jgi:hypothetical protein
MPCLQIIRQVARTVCECVAPRSSSYCPALPAVRPSHGPRDTHTHTERERRRDEVLLSVWPSIINCRPTPCSQPQVSPRLGLASLITCILAPPALRYVHTYLGSLSICGLHILACFLLRRCVFGNHGRSRCLLCVAIRKYAMEPVPESSLCSLSDPGPKQQRVH